MSTGNFSRGLSWLCLLLAVFSFSTGTSPAQQNPLTIDLRDALDRARRNSPQLQSASVTVEIAQLDRRLAKLAFYPSANYFNQYVYTEGNGTPSGVFVANDGVHIYNSQAIVHQDVYAPSRMAEYRRAVAAVAVAAAKREVAVRGLIATLIQSYYSMVASQRHFATAQQSLDEARRFVDITLKLESGGEVAHSDVVKAQLTLQQRERELQEARLAIEKSRVTLGVLIFSDYTTEFNIVDDLGSAVSLPPFDQLNALAREANADLHAAQATLRQESYGVAIARSGYLPSLALDYFFGINANQFAVRDPEGHQRLGLVAQATLNIPVFDWWTTRSKVRQAELKRRQAELDVAQTQRELVSSLRLSYLEAQTALAELENLKRSLDLSAESLRLTNLRYQAGEISVLEVVDAQNTLAQSRNAYDDGLSRYRAALANLQTLTGNY